MTNKTSPNVTPELLSKWGRMGGKAGKPENRAFSRDPELRMRAAKLGGKIGAEREKKAAWQRGYDAALKGEPMKAKPTQSWKDGYMAAKPLDPPS